MNDWIGLLFFGVLIVGVFVGLKILAKPRRSTEAEFERNAAGGSTLLGTSLNALQGILDPAAAKAKETQTQLKEGRYGKKKREGKANGEDLNEINEIDEENDERE